MIEDVIATTENCRYCLMCRHVCPVGHVTRKETLTPHGWGLTIASIKREMLPIDEDVVDVIYSCADCGTCRANCVTDQPLPSAIAAMRSELATKGIAPAAAYAVKERLETWSNPYVDEEPIPSDQKGRVALFVGDDFHYLGREALEAALRLLAAVGIEPVLIGTGRNNGYLASTLGFPETAEKLMRATLAELEFCEAETLLVLRPGDYYALRHLREDRLKLSWPGDVVLQEVIPFLAGHLEAGKLDFSRSADERPYAYVDPTHSVRVKGRYDAPRQLLAAVMPAPARELFWRRERAHPAGNVALQYTKPHIANHLAYSRLADALENGARLLITEDPGGLSYLQQFTPKFGLEIRSFYELIDQHLVT